MTRVESLGSFWMIDEGRYCRFPKSEQPRENGWGGPEAGALQDAVWHDFAGEWRITDNGFLFIQTRWDDDEQDWRCVVAPDARVVG